MKIEDLDEAEHARLVELVEAFNHLPPEATTVDAALAALEVVRYNIAAFKMVAKDADKAWDQVGKLTYDLARVNGLLSKRDDQISVLTATARRSTDWTSELIDDLRTAISEMTDEIQSLEGDIEIMTCVKAESDARIDVLQAKLVANEQLRARMCETFDAAMTAVWDMHRAELEKDKAEVRRAFDEIFPPVKLVEEAQDAQA